jgi:hypothetical protein
MGNCFGLFKKAFTKDELNFRLCEESEDSITRRQLVCTLRVGCCLKASQVLPDRRMGVHVYYAWCSACSLRICTRL